MIPIVLTSRVGSDGVLQLTLPLGAAEANQEMNITVEPAQPTMSQDEWRKRVLSTAGSILIRRSFAMIKATMRSERSCRDSFAGLKFLH